MPGILGWVALLYFLEGAPYGLIKDVVPVYFRVHGVSLTEIGLTSLLGLPWTLKLVWAPLVERYGSLRLWIVMSALCVAILVAALPFFSASTLSPALWVVLFGITVASATQDIAIDAYTIVAVPSERVGSANGVRISAYRVALIVIGGAFVALASSLGWPTIFGLAAGSLVVLAVLMTRLSGAARGPSPTSAFPWQSALDWLAQPHALWVVGFVLLYKLGDAAIGPMVKPFWLASGFSAGELGLVSTSLGVAWTIVGALVGGVWTSRVGLLRSLWVLGLFQAASNLVYAAVAWAHLPKPTSDMTSLGGMVTGLAEPARLAIYAASVAESFTAGLGSAAFLAFLMAACDKTRAATQYALLSALFAVGGSLAGALSGWATERLGYGPYFLLTFGLALPAYVFLPKVRQFMEKRPVSMVVSR